MLSKDIKKVSLRIFLVLEVIVFSLFYFFGTYGLKMLQNLEKDNKRLLVKISTLKREIKQLKVEIVNWNTDDFYKEKVAREFLQMAYPDEEIYFIS